MSNIGFADLRDSKPWMDFRCCDIGLDPYEMTVYVHICRRASGRGESTMTINRLADACSMSRRKLLGVLGSLVKRKMIAVIDDPHMCTDRRRTVYAPTPTSHWQTLDEDQKEDEKKVHHMHCSGSVGAPHALIEINRCTTCTEIGAPRAPIQTLLDLKEQAKKISRSNDREQRPSGRRNSAPGSSVWSAYSEGMKTAWKVEPPRSAKTAAQAKRLVELVGIDNAIRLAEYFPTVAKKYYIDRAHDFGILLNDYQALLRDLTLGFRVTNEITRKIVSESDSQEYRKAQDIGAISSEDPFEQLAKCGDAGRLMPHAAEEVFPYDN